MRKQGSGYGTYTTYRSKGKVRTVDEMSSLSEYIKEDTDINTYVNSKGFKDNEEEEYSNKEGVD